MVAENNFSPSDLIQYVQMLVKESLSDTSNYSWLKARHIQPEILKTSKELEKLRPMIQEMSSENCAKIAVKLDNLTDGVCSATAILATFKSLLHEQYSMQLLEYSVKRAKSKKHNRINKVHPELSPNGRVPTVSFRLQP